MANINDAAPFKTVVLRRGVYTRFLKNSAIANNSTLRVYTTSNGMGEAIPLQDSLQGSSPFDMRMNGVTPAEQPLALYTMRHQLDMGIQEMQHIAHATMSRVPRAPRAELVLQRGRCKAVSAAMKALAGDDATLEMIVAGGDGGEERRKLVRCRLARALSVFFFPRPSPTLAAGLQAAHECGGRRSGRVPAQGGRRGPRARRAQRAGRRAGRRAG